MLDIRECDGLGANNIQIRLGFPGSGFASLYYGNGDGVLPEYTPIKYIRLDAAGNGTYELCAELIVPETADRIWAFPEDDLTCGEFCLLTDQMKEKSVGVGMGEPELVFYAVSDLHTITKPGAAQRYQDEAWKHIAGEPPSFVVLAGDVTNGAQAEEFEICRRKMIRSLEGIPVFAVFGNHDFHGNHQGELPDHESRRAFRIWLEERNRELGVETEYFDEYNYHVSAGGVHLIALQGVDYRGKLYMVGDEVLAWLDQCLTEHAGEVQIVVCHYPLADEGGRVFLRGNKRLQQILERCEKVLYVAGHTHDSLDSDVPAVNKKGGVIRVNTSSVGNSEPDCREIGALRAVRDRKRFPGLETCFRCRSMGLRVELYGDCGIVRGIDFSENRFIPRCQFKVSVK